MDRGKKLTDFQRLKEKASAIEEVLMHLAFWWALILVAGFAGCSEESEKGVPAPHPSEFGYQTPVQTSLIAEGQVAYRIYCVGCHGEKGDGNGKAALFLRPKPRDFTLGQFKFQATRSGRLPTEEDLKRTIREGLKGSAMPGWNLLPVRTVNALVAYLKTFSSKWESSRPAERIPRVENPYATETDKSEAIARGEAVYHGFATCWTCHPAYVSQDRINQYLVAMENPPRDAFRPHLFESEGKENSEGKLIYPQDFRRDFVRSGADLEDLYRSIGAGITGTAMPTWIDSMDYASEKEGHPPLVQPTDIWSLAYYVQDLILSRPAKFAEGAFQVRDRRQMIYLHGKPAGTEQPALPEPDIEEEEFSEDD